MATEITMPKLSDTMEEGVLISWKKSIGERVERGDIIAEIETDKATMELEAFASGVLLETRVKAGDLVPVGTVIGIIGSESEKLTSGEVSPRAELNVKDGDSETKPDLDVSERVPHPEKPATVTKSKVEPPARGRKEALDEQSEGGAEKALPMVRRMARDQGIDLSRVTGTGPEGRILKEDLEAFLQHAEAKQADTKPSGNAEGLVDTAGRIPPRRSSLTGGSEPLSRMRTAIARTVTESWRTIPHFTVSMDIDMGAAESLHKGFKEAGDSVSLNDFIIKSVATVLRDFPRLNASWADDRIEIHPEVNIGIAVTVADGLLVPCLHDCGNLSLREIASQSRELIERARTGKIAQGDLGGGTFTISNMGMLGVDAFTAIILPPQAGILAIGTVADAAVVRNGHITVARMMTAVLSADHRMVDGAYGAGFMKELKQVLENPVRLMV
ncbi:MAG: dihydrolipoamide acetyltransferase family protein [Geobacteraceae bacterium]